MKRAFVQVITMMSRQKFRGLILVLLVIVGVSAQKKKSNVIQFSEHDWENMLEGEWMVEFYAPWCPACKALEPIWEGLAFQKKELGINVGKVDVTDAPGLSGRFMVTALPTIYHVKDGIFRQYKSPRDKDSLIEFISKKTWTKVEPVSSWKSPTSFQMSIVSHIFTTSQVLRGFHHQLMEEYGMPAWGTYLVFALGTIIFGAVIGLVIVCIIDCIYPPKTSSKDKEIVASINDDLEDDVPHKSGEKFAAEEKSEVEKTDKESKSSQPNSPNTHKRKARKAD